MVPNISDFAVVLIVALQMGFSEILVSGNNANYEVELIVLVDCVLWDGQQVMRSG